MAPHALQEPGVLGEGGEDDAVRVRLIAVLLECLRHKVIGSGTSEHNVEHFMASHKAAHEQSTDEVMKRVGALIPTSYKALLHMLAELNYYRMQTNLEYDQCKNCYLVYRGEHKHLKQCPTSGCGHPRQGGCTKLLYRSVTEWLHSVYAQPTLAWLMSAWRQRWDEPKVPDAATLLRDIHDGDFVQGGSDGTTSNIHPARSYTSYVVLFLC